MESTKFMRNKTFFRFNLLTLANDLFRKMVNTKQSDLSKQLKLRRKEFDVLNFSVM